MPRVYSKGETQIERDVADWWEERGYLHLKVVIWGRAGWPDHFFFGPRGRMKMIEFKKPGDEPTPLQDHIHSLLRRLGHDVEVHDNKEEACASLARMC